MTTIPVTRACDLGPALREARLAEGITQSALSHLAGVGRQWLNAFELGDKPAASLDMVMRVVAALGVTVTLAAPEPIEEEPDDVIDLDALLEGLS